jgi:hypothetical protein
VVRSLYQDGDLKDDDIRDDEKLREKLKEFLEKIDFIPVTDYLGSLLKNARRFKLAEDYEDAILFYAIFFEHTINRIIDAACRKKKIDKKTAIEIIKSVSIHGKVNWLFILLGIPKRNAIHKKRLLEIAEERNSYVHYKWKGYDFDNKDIRIISLLNDIDKTVTYKKKFEANFLYNRRKGLITKSVQ